jgi:hypothetical protein
MRIFYSVCLPISIGIVPGMAAYAADNLGDLDVTIQVIDSKQNVNDFINRIELPKGVAESVPSAGQSPKPTDKSSKTRHPENTSVSRRDSVGDRDRDNPQNNIDSDTDKNGQPDLQERSPGLDSTSIMDNPRRDVTETRDRPDYVREQRDTIERQRPVDGSPSNWDKLRDSYPSSTWSDRKK